MTNKIVVVEFPNSSKRYEYLCDESMEIKSEANLAIFGSTFAITLAETNEIGIDEITKIKAHLNEFKIVKIIEFKPITDQEYAGKLRPIVGTFSIDWFVEQTARKLRLTNLKLRLEEAAKNVSVITQLESLGEKLSPETKALLEEYKKLI